MLNFVKEIITGGEEVRRLKKKKLWKEKKLVKEEKKVGGKESKMKKK